MIKFGSVVRMSVGMLVKINRLEQEKLMDELKT